MKKLFVAFMSIAILSFCFCGCGKSDSEGPVFKELDKF